MNMKAKKGSALLIVLGMLAIMIASAVGFAVYMRNSRLPSSYLRRSASSRQLVKAALSLAIEQIDVAINNNPHPGVGALDSSRGRYGSNLSNAWWNRVFMGLGTCSNSTSAAASPLCLEALAYVPPPLIDSVRYWSQNAGSALWQPLGFDAGRYSWIAVDVSDYFDVNRLVADSPRTSAANRRVSLAYLCEDERHSSGDRFAPEWDSFMEKYRGKVDENTMDFDFKSVYPFISLADFNLALGAKGDVGEFKSYFCDYIEGSIKTFGRTGSEREDEYLSRMVFVTDGLFPCPADGERRTAEGETIYDITSGENQPYDGKLLETEDLSPSECMLGKSLQNSFKNEMRGYDRLSGLGCAALYDYLDLGHEPLSLAIPTTERVPMICGLTPVFPNAKFGIERDYQYKSGDKPHENGSGGDGAPNKYGETREVEQVIQYKVKGDLLSMGFTAGDVRSLVCFPFNHKDNSDGTFKTDGRFSLFLTTGDVSVRTGMADGDIFHLAKGNEDNPLKNGIMSVVLSGESAISPKGMTISEEEDAVKLIPHTLAAGNSGVVYALEAAGNEILTVKYRWTQTVKTRDGGMSLYWSPTWEEVKGDQSYIVEAHCGIPPSAWANGACKGVDPDLASDAAALNFVKGGNTKAVSLRAAVWLRVKEGERVVDMVPACFRDDQIQNDVADSDPRMEILGESNLGASYPLMLFGTGVDFNFSVAGLDELADQPKDISITPANVMVADPRFNHAPEHWHVAQKESTPANWLDAVHKIMDAGDERDGDIFMATSDAGYLQSRHELAFIPRFTNLQAGGDVFGSYQAPDSQKFSSFPSGFDSVRNSGLMWVSYDVTDISELVPWYNDGSGAMVNPYSDSTNVIMAAFANTPMDWAHSSTNYVEGEEWDPSQKASEFNKKYAFNEYSSEKNLRIEWEDLQAIAGRFMGEVRSRGSWTEAWRNLDWYGDLEEFCNVKLGSDTADLWTADRKFLYGFWRDSFAAKQQLFLVFVRAEPTMMGAGNSASTPPQLGAKAMALVWRDPTAARAANLPHQTRILFYRQFE